MGDRFGWSVAVSGTRVVVGAGGDDTGATNAGSAYVYDLAGATPTMPMATLNHPNSAVNDFFGSSVAVDGATVIVGAFGVNGAADRGAAYIFAPVPPTGGTMTLAPASPAGL